LTARACGFVAALLSALGFACAPLRSAQLRLYRFLAWVSLKKTLKRGGYVGSLMSTSPKYRTRFTGRSNYLGMGDWGRGISEMRSLCGRRSCPGVCSRVCHCPAGLERSRQQFAQYRNKLLAVRQGLRPQVAVAVDCDPEFAPESQTRACCGVLNQPEHKRPPRFYRTHYVPDELAPSGIIWDFIDQILRNRRGDNGTNSRNKGSQGSTY